MTIFQVSAFLASVDVLSHLFYIHVYMYMCSNYGQDFYLLNNAIITCIHNIFSSL